MFTIERARAAELTHEHEQKVLVVCLDVLVNNFLERILGLIRAFIQLMQAGNRNHAMRTKLT